LVPHLESAGVRLAYDARGKGPAVTFLHGFTQSRAMWDEILELLPPGWRLVRPDLRGHGDTAVAHGGGYTMDACLGDLEALWQELGVERTHLVGYSMGARLALHVAARVPRRLLSLVAISARPPLDEEARAARREADYELARAIERRGIDWFVEHWEALPMFAGVARRGPQFASLLHERRLRNRPHELAASLRGMGVGVAEPVFEQLRGFEGPALFVAGSEDAPYPEGARTLAGLVRCGRFEVVAGAGHNIPAERPAELARLLAAHLSTL
jgi:2-succinyl-6-hydroxy-2,4-cyclohexadiene-1-carboxylate synthase